MQIFLMKESYSVFSLNWLHFYYPWSDPFWGAFSQSFPLNSFFLLHKKCQMATQKYLLNGFCSPRNRVAGNSANN